MQKEEGYRLNAEADSLLPVADPDIASLENSVFYKIMEIVRAFWLNHIVPENS